MGLDCQIARWHCKEITLLLWHALRILAFQFLSVTLQQGFYLFTGWITHPSVWMSQCPRRWEAGHRNNMSKRSSAFVKQSVWTEVLSLPLNMRWLDLFTSLSQALTACGFKLVASRFHPNLERLSQTGCIFGGGGSWRRNNSKLKVFQTVTAKDFRREITAIQFSSKVK